MFLRYIAVLLVLSSALTTGAAIEIGSSKQDAFTYYGDPQGTIDMGDVSIYLYPRGSIWIKEGYVSKVDMVSVEDFERMEQARKNNVQRMAEQQALYEASALEHMRSLVAKRLDDPDFQREPATTQWNFWKRVAKNYPAIEIPADKLDFEKIKGNRHALLVEDARQRKVLAEKEAAAAKAEREAKAAQGQDDIWGSNHSFYYGYIYPRCVVRPQRPTYSGYRIGYNDGNWSITIGGSN